MSVSYLIIYTADAECVCLSVCLSVNSGTRQMFSQGMADVLLDACSDFWDGHDIRPLGNEERYETSMSMLLPAIPV